MHLTSSSSCIQPRSAGRKPFKTSARQSRACSSAAHATASHRSDAAPEPHAAADAQVSRRGALGAGGAVLLGLGLPQVPALAAEAAGSAIQQRVTAAVPHTKLAPDLSVSQVTYCCDCQHACDCALLLLPLGKSIPPLLDCTSPLTASCTCIWVQQPYILSTLTTQQCAACP